MRVWWCNQSGQWDVERGNEVVCSADTRADGGNVTHRKTVGDVKAGDLVVHYRKRQVVAFSRAREAGSYQEVLPPLRGEGYGAGWRFRTEYFDLKRPVLREDFSERLIPLRVTHYPIDSRGFVCQGYLFPFDLRGLAIILSFVDEGLPAWLDILRPGMLPLPDEVAESLTLTEGAVSRITVNAYERSPEARRRCIERYGARCVVCGFDFGEEYGEVAEGLIHVHHLKPISQLGESYKVDPLVDLCPVCPNCHAVIHLRNGLPYTVEEVRSFLASTQEGQRRLQAGGIRVREAAARRSSKEA